MAGVKRGLLLALLLGGAVFAQGGSLKCKSELRLSPGGSAPPSDIAVDASGRLYVLHENDGFMDIYDAEGRQLQHRGGQAESRLQPTGVTAQSLWVGRLGKSALAVSEAGQNGVRGFLVPGPHSLDYIPIQGLPESEQISGSVALARDLSGNFYVWSETPSRCYHFSPEGVYTGAQRLPQLRRPLQLAVDTDGQLFCLDTRGLHVITPSGSIRYGVEGALCMYLTGSNVLALAGRDWLRQYGPDGEMDSEVRVTDAGVFEQNEPVALSINDDGNYFVYLRDPDRNDGRILKLSMKGKILAEFPQPTRPPSSPDPGTRIDYQGRIVLWQDSGRFLRLHPSGKREADLPYVLSADPKGQLVKPADLAAGPDGAMWVADAGNCRLQRFTYSGGWQKPIVVGIQNGDPRGEPRSLAWSPFGILFCVVYPRGGQGDVVLQTRRPDGKLLAQRSICPAWGQPVVKITCDPTGELYLYASRDKTIRGWEDAPTLFRYARKGQQAAKAGGDGPNLSAPNDPARRVVMKPQEDLVWWNGRLLVPSGGSVFMFNRELQAVREYGLAFKGGRNPRFGEFGGAAVRGKLLYIVDSGGECVQRALLP